MSWIKVIDYHHADSKLKGIYDRIKGSHAQIDNVLKIHSLRPHTLEGHMTLYKNVLHHSSNTLPKWYLELIGVYVSHLNQCEYCVQHHSEGLRRLLDHDPIYQKLITAIQTKSLREVLDKKEFEGTVYVDLLTTNLTDIKETQIKKLRSSGFTDGEILEINQVASYFNYVNRTVLGLGVNTNGDILGLAPKDGDDPSNWSHS